MLVFKSAAKRPSLGAARMPALIVVSHSMATIKQYCDCGGVLVEGQLLMFDTPDKAIEMYNRLNR